MKPIVVHLVAALGIALLAGRAGWEYLPAPDLAAEAAAPQPAEAGPLAQGPEYEQCLGLLRESPDAARGFALAWEAQGGGEGARHCAALALLASGDPARAAERLESIGTRSNAAPAARAAVLAQAVEAWTLAGDVNRAIGAATLALTLLPGDADLLLDRAIALGGQGRHAEALADLDQAVVAAPDRAEIWVLRATALRRTDKTEAAERAIQRALALDPESAEALLERGILRLERGDRAGANADWRQAVALAPDSAAADLAAQNLALNEAGPARR